MSNQRYKILWIDDEYKSMSANMATAVRYDLKFIPFKSLNAGMEELEKNYRQYDGVLFDAQILENEDDAPGTENVNHLARIKERLAVLPKKFDMFVYTGQAEAYDDKYFNGFYGKKNIYKKGDKDERARLFTNLQQSAAAGEEANIYRKYPFTLEICDGNLLDKFVYDDLLGLLKSLEADTMHADHLPIIRKIAERTMRSLQGHGLLPPEVENLNGQGLLLCGKHSHFDETKKAYILHNDSLPARYHQRMIRALIEITQEGAHGKALDDYLKSRPDISYLPKAIMYQLLEYLRWFHSYVSNPPKANNWKLE